MPKVWKEWEGQVVGEFRLREYLGGSERAGVFLTAYGPESRKAAIKLIPVETSDPAAIEAELLRLNAARELSHPHLLQIFQTGRAKSESTELLFVVMEYAEEDLSQILPTRPLQAGEVREMLKPTLEALAYLHAKGFGHGHLKPSNVMAVGDQLKLSTDGISRIGEKRGLPGESSDNDPPESAWGEMSAASDIWSLGILLVLVLTQHLPAWDASGDEPVPVENVPPPFGDIARHCLQRDARSRWSLAEIAARMGFGSAAETKKVAKAELRQGAIAARAAEGTQSAAPSREKLQAAPTQEKASSGTGNSVYKPGANAWSYMAAAVVLVIVAVLVGPRLFRSGTIGPQTVDSQTRDSGSDSKTAKRQRNGAAVKRSTGGAAQPARADSEIATVSDKGEGSEAAKDDARLTGKAAGPSATRTKASRRGLTAGQVAQQVVPDVPKSARETIRGTVRVGVRISVDSEGNVTEAELDPAGPSKYFAQVALDAAQQWKFEPPKVEGRNVLSDWLLQFQFTEKGTKVIPVQSDP